MQSIDTYECGKYRITIMQTDGLYFLSGIFWTQNPAGEYLPLLTRQSGIEFCTSVVTTDAQQIKLLKNTPAEIVLELSTHNEYFIATEKITLSAKSGVSITQKYLMQQSFSGWLHPNFVLQGQDIRYSYPLQVYDLPMSEVDSMRCDAAWAVPLTAHIWHTDSYTAVYGADRSTGRGTLDCTRTNSGDSIQLGVYYPDVTDQSRKVHAFVQSNIPTDTTFSAGEEIVLSQFVMAAALDEGDNPLLLAEKMAASVMLADTPAIHNPEAIADKLGDYYLGNQLWESDALGAGEGWYRNMWVHTQAGTPEKDPFYDLGWGEGYGALTISALVRYMSRTKRDYSLQIDQMTRGMRHFLRDKDVPGAYYDRFIPTGARTPLGLDLDGNICDFMGTKKIWTHSLGQIGYQLISLFEDIKDYPDPEIRGLWYKNAKDIGDFLLSKQQADGDLQDGFDENDNNTNKKPHKIPARAIVCGLWAKLYCASGDSAYLDAAVRLSQAVSPEIVRYEFYNQMLDGHCDIMEGNELLEIYDAENACYAFQGLCELYHIAPNIELRGLCDCCAAYFISWMYFYDLETGYNGITRGATTCRMYDFPLVYLGASCFAFRSLMQYTQDTGDGFFSKIADEMLCCIIKYQYDAPETPWHHGIIHAMDQNNGMHWGPDREGQMDSGMTSGNALINLEYVIGQRG